jgi:hypothetical protein
MITQEVYEQTSINALSKIRAILHQAEQVHPDIPMSIMVSLLADVSLLNESPETFEEELLNSIRQCRTLRYDMICNEASSSIHH